MILTRLLVLAGLLFASVPAVAAPAACPKAGDDLVAMAASLPAVAPHLKAGDVLHVLAVGSATMFGPDAALQPGTITSQALGAGSGPGAGTATGTGQPPSRTSAAATEQAFPLQMAHALERTIPGLKVDVVLRGGRGLSAADMLNQMKDVLKPGAFQLVLWQTGTVEAVRNTPVGDFAQVLAEGTEAVESAGANLILIDPQFSRFLQTNSNLEPYLQALQTAGAMQGVALFRRYELMRAWANDGQLDLENTPKPQRRSAVEQLHVCLGQELAKMVAGNRS